MFIVAGQTPIASKPPEATLGDPAPWQYFKALGAWFALNDLQRPAKVLTGVFDNGFAGPIGPDQLEPAPAVVETLLVAVEERLQSQLAAFGILPTGAVHDHHQQETQRIDHNMPFAAVGLFVHVHTARLTAFGSFHTLAIDAGRAGLWFMASLLACLSDQRRIDLFIHPAAFPARKVAIDRLPRRQILGQHAPLAPRASDIKDGVHNQPHLPLAPPASLAGRKVLFNLFPFAILEIGLVGLRE